MIIEAYPWVVRMTYISSSYVSKSFLHVIPKVMVHSLQLQVLFTDSVFKLDPKAIVTSPDAQWSYVQPFFLRSSSQIIVFRSKLWMMDVLGGEGFIEGGLSC